MKKILFLQIIFLFSLLHANDLKKHILILHSYSHEYKWTQLQHSGFISTLEKSLISPVDISVEYLDTKRHDFTDEYSSFFLHYLQEKYKNSHFDAIYVTDDNALNFYLKTKNDLFQNTPTFFSGINNLSLHSSLDPSMFTGVYETKDIVPNIELIHQFSPQTHEIWILGDTSNTYKSIENDIKKKIGQFPKYTFHFLTSNNIDDITKNLPDTPKSFVLLTTIGGWMDKSGMNLSPKESIKLLKLHSNIILCSMEDAYVVDSVVGGYVTSGLKQGSSAADLMIRYLNGEALITIHSIVKSPNIYMFDSQAMVHSRLILSEYIARNAVVLHPKKSFFEKYYQIFLDIVFIGFIGFMIFSVIIYFISLNKKRQLTELQCKLDALTVECTSYKEMLNDLHKTHSRDHENSL